MNKKLKTLLCTALIACTSIFASFAVGCGAFDQLICEHEYGTVTTLEYSTCTTKGKGEKTCTLCGKVEAVELDYEKHTPVTVATVEATCTEEGHTDYTVCYVCEKVLAPSAVISPLGHTVVKDEAVAAKCLDNGWTEGEHCGRCGEVFVAQKEIEATGHVVVAVEAKAATCTEAGWTAGQKCENCDQGYAGCEAIPATGHSDEDGDGECDICEINVCAEGMHVEETISAVAATCTADGWTEGVQCANCEEVLTAPQTVPATGHTVSDYVDYCEICNEVVVTEDIWITVNGAIAENEDTPIALLGYEWFFFYQGKGYLGVDNDRSSEILYLGYEEAELPDGYLVSYNLADTANEIIKEIIQVENGCFIKFNMAHFELPYITAASDYVFVTVIEE